MAKRKSSRLDSFDSMIGLISIHAESIEQLINEAYYFYCNHSTKDNKEIIKLALYRNGLKINSNIDYLVCALNRIMDYKIRREFEEIIMHVMYFYKLKEKLASGLLYADDYINSNGISNVNRYEYIRITPNFLKMVNDAAITARVRLWNDHKRREGII